MASAPSSCPRPSSWTSGAIPWSTGGPCRPNWWPKPSVRCGTARGGPSPCVRRNPRPDRRDVTSSPVAGVGSRRAKIDRWATTTLDVARRRSLSHDRAAMGAHRLHRVRRTADPHRHVASALRGAGRLARCDRVRGRRCNDQPLARSGVDAAGHPVCLASEGMAGRHSSVAPASSSPASGSSLRSRPSSSSASRRSGCAAPRWAWAPRWRPWP